MRRMRGLGVFTVILACGLGGTACHASFEARAAGSGARPCPSPDAANVDRGPPPSARGNGVHVTLECGTYQGDLVVHGNDVWVHGAGKGQTIVDGRLDVHGNGVHVTDLTVRGESNVSGNNVDVSGVEMAGPSKVKGNSVTK
jgi:hypothetical protein